MNSVALVVLDTMRKDAFDRRFDWLPGRRFEHAWSTAKWTMPAHASLFTGGYPSELGVGAKAEGLDCAQPTIAELVSRAGHTPRAFSANLMASPVFGFDRGFASFEGSWRVNANSKGLGGWRELLRNGRAGLERYLALFRHVSRGHYRITPSIAAGLSRRLSKALDSVEPADRDDGATAFLESIREGRYADTDFLFANLMEAHAPYLPARKYRTTPDATYDEVAATLTDEEPDPALVRSAYDDSVRYLSDRYRRIFTALRERFDYVLTVGDHGELFGEHGSWRHLHGVHPELTHVPLVVSGEGLSGVSRETVNLLDVHRTVLEILDLAGPSRGQDLRGPIESRPAFVEYEGLRATRLESMAEAGYDDELVRTYDRPLAGVATDGSYYGYETLEGWTEEGTARTANPRELLAEFRSSMPESTENDSADVSEAVRARLEELGYA